MTIHPMIGNPLTPEQPSHYKLQISNKHWDEMLADVIAKTPEEACGLVAGIGGEISEVFPLTNELHSPVRYRIPPRDQIRLFKLFEETGVELLAIYHSHPNGPPIPSPTDIAEAGYPEAVYLIWSQKNQCWDCRGFLISEGSFQEISVQKPGGLITNNLSSYN